MSAPMLKPAKTELCQALRVNFPVADFFRLLRAELESESSMFQLSQLLEVAKGAAPVSEAEFQLFKRAMSEQGLSKSSTRDVITAAAKKGKQMDAWGASGGMPRV